MTLEEQLMKSFNQKRVNLNNMTTKKSLNLKLILIQANKYWNKKVGIKFKTQETRFKLWLQSIDRNNYGLRAKWRYQDNQEHFQWQKIRSIIILCKRCQKIFIQSTKMIKKQTDFFYQLIQNQTTLTNMIHIFSRPQTLLKISSIKILKNKMSIKIQWKIKLELVVGFKP